MKNRIYLYGILHADIGCQECGCSESIEIEIDQQDFLDDYDIDLYVYSNDIRKELDHQGWREIGGKLICPECAENLKENNHEQR